jgi:hypothetical protein
MLRALLLIAAMLLPAGALAESKTFIGQGLCDGKDQVAIKEQPWEDRPITIRGVTIGLLTQPPTAMAYAFAGNSFMPDVIALQIGPGASPPSLPAGITFSLPGHTDSPDVHVDAHVSCAAAALDPPPAPPEPPKGWLASLAARLRPPPPPTPAPAPAAIGADLGAHDFQVWLVIYYTVP